MRQRTLIAEIAVGVIISVIAAVIIAHFGIDKPHPPPAEVNPPPVREVSPSPITERQLLTERQPRPTVEKRERTFSLIGSWRGSFLVNNNPINDVYIFYANGTWAERVFDQLGQQIGSGSGVYSYDSGEVNISFLGGGSETGSVTWIDSNNFRYRITDHTETEQIGLEVHYKRLSY